MRLFLLSLTAAAVMATQPFMMTNVHAQTSAAAPAQSADDPYLWLEEVQGAKALEFVKQHSQETQKKIEASDGFTKTRDRILGVLNDRSRIPGVSKMGDFYYNFWRDAKNVRGVWRRTTWEEYQKPEPKWETVLDVDQLAADEKENWQFAGSECLYPKYQRCLMRFSRGGGDATVMREFDLTTKSFVKDGFSLPEAKGGAGWIDENTLFVATDFGPGSMTKSGYARIAKVWQRGTPLTAAKTVFEGKEADVWVGASADIERDRTVRVITRAYEFFDWETFVLEGDKLVKLPNPSDARVSFYRDRVLVTTKTDWKIGNTTFKGGSIVWAPYKDFVAGKLDSVKLLFEPTSRMSQPGFTTTRDYLIVQALNNVRSSAVEFKYVPNGWERREVALPPNSMAGLSAVNQDSNDVWFTTTDFFTPTTLSIGKAGNDQRKALKNNPVFFDKSGLISRQFEATSADGTKVPYFVLSRENVKLDGTNPTLLYGYGGFNISLTPSYSGGIGIGWLERGGVYVLSNIRGGGEFGPQWHLSALKQNRQRAFDDFIAIAQDLVTRGITKPKHLGIMGGSNGGLLVGAVMTQRPDLFGAVVCQVPLLDMKRFHTLLAGNSWMGEYGNPDKPEEWAYISKYSPYQNVKKDAKYPRVLFATSTRDDRVHPGHARKMFAKMKDMGHDVMYFENTEGGHAGAANNIQRANIVALEYQFLWDSLK